MEIPSTRLEMRQVNVATSATHTGLDFEQVYAQYDKYVYNVCLGVLGNADDAQDAAQDTFIQVYQSLPGYKEQGQVGAWIYRIAVNKCRDLLRRRRATASTEGLDSMAAPDAPEHDWMQEERVRGTILTLKPEYRIVLVLFYFLNLSSEEIAQCLRCPGVQVRVRLHRARKAFRKQYGDGGPDHAM